MNEPQNGSGNSADARGSGERWVVMKFGGTSVSSRQRWETIASVAMARISEGFRPFIVCSALSGVSDLLEKTAEAAPDGKHGPCVSEIIQKHRILGRELGVDVDTVLKNEFDAVERLSLGISLVREVSPAVRAQLMAAGELMSTRLGAAWLAQNGLAATWIDARDWLKSAMTEGQPDTRRFLSAGCHFDADETLISHLRGFSEKAIITQGFIASDESGRTVLLGRGGSDTSAAYFASKLSAARCEIWTDVPGVFSANPSLVPSAVLLSDLDYDEAQEIMTTGAKVLHPRCIHPVKHAGIPMIIKSTLEPLRNGTVISRDAGSTDAGLKAISTKRGVTLVSMETINMWQEVGFLADIAACFKSLGLSIDSVSTSETNVTVSLDRISNVIDRLTIESLERELSKFCKVRIIENCALISLVGRDIRSILHKLGPVFEVFEEKKIYLVTQASNDLNLSFIVDEDEAERVVTDLHRMLFAPPTKSEDHHGEAISDTPEIAPVVPDHLRRPEQIWWKKRRSRLLEMAARETPLYVYDEQTIVAMVGQLNGLRGVDRCLYAVKANWNRDVLRVVHELGMGFECVSPGEIEHLMSVIPELRELPERILFTPNFAPRHEYEFAFGTGVHVTLDNLFPLQHWPDVFKGREVFVRLDPGVGRGHHEYVQTAGVKSKFGVVPGQIDELKRLAAACGARITGLHAHTGSGITAPETWNERAGFLLKAAAEFPDVKTLDLGGGMGIPEKPGAPSLDMKAVDESLKAVKAACGSMSVWIEPGRYVIAQAGVLLAKVTQTKPKGDLLYVGIDAGMNALIRPALYGSFHEIVNLSKADRKPDTLASVVGPICESGDTLGHNRLLAAPEEGDVLLIATAGAYGRAMSSEYNMRRPPAERLLSA